MFPDYDRWKNEVIGQTTNDLTYDNFFTPRIQSTAYTQLLHNMQLHYSGAQLSVIELPYHAQGGFPHQITREHVLHNLPRQNRLLVIELTGAEIREAIEMSAAVFAVNANGDIDFSLTVFYPELHPFIYDLWGGVDYEIDLHNPVGQRVTKLTYQGNAIQDDARFTVAVNSYRATGAHQFHMFQKSSIRESKQFIPQLMMEYIEQHRLLTVEIKNTFQMK